MDTFQNATPALPHVAPTTTDPGTSDKRVMHSLARPKFTDARYADDGVVARVVRMRSMMPCSMALSGVK